MADLAVGLADICLDYTVKWRDASSDALQQE